MSLFKIWGDDSLVKDTWRECLTEKSLSSVHWNGDIDGEARGMMQVKAYKGNLPVASGIGINSPTWMTHTYIYKYTYVYICIFFHKLRARGELGR